VVAQYETPGELVSKQNRRFHFSPGVLSGAVAPLQEMPTTAAMYVLQNTYPLDSGIHLVIDQVAAFCFSATTGAISSTTIIAGVPALPHASALTNSAGVVGPRSNTGSTARSSLGIWATGATLASAPAWFVIGAGPPNIAAPVFPYGGVVADLTSFPIIVRPGNYYAGFHILSAAGTGVEFSMSCIYHEAEMALGT
jgi:hypothetical protein